VDELALAILSSMPLPLWAKEPREPAAGRQMSILVDIRGTELCRHERQQPSDVRHKPSNSKRLRQTWHSTNGKRPKRYEADLSTTAQSKLNRYTPWLQNFPRDCIAMTAKVCGQEKR
jgi:hypothetical protein